MEEIITAKTREFRRMEFSKVSEAVERGRRP